MNTVAILGAGLMGRWHLDAALCAGARVGWIVDPDLGRAHALARRRRTSAAAVASIDEVDFGEVEIAHVCTPVGTRAGIVPRVLEAGVHALVEKPLAPTAVETDELLALADDRGVLLCPTHQYLFQRGTLEAAERLSTLGPVVHVRGVICSAGGEGRSPEAGDRIAGEVLVHPLSLLARLFAWPIDDLAWSAVRPAPGELRATARVEDATIDVMVSMRARPTESSLEILSERGSLHLDLFHGFAVFEGGKVSRTRKLARPFGRAVRTLAAAGLNLAGRAATRETAFPGLRTLVRRFHAAVASGGPGIPIAPEETRTVARARDLVLDRVDHA